MASVFPEMLAFLLEKTNFFQSLQKLIFHPSLRGPTSQEAPRRSSKPYLNMLFTTDRFLVFPSSRWSFNVVICFLIKLSFLTGLSFIHLGLSHVKKWSLVYSRLPLKVLIENIQVLIF